MSTIYTINLDRISLFCIVLYCFCWFKTYLLVPPLPATATVGGWRSAWDGARRKASGGDAGADGQAEIGVPYGAEVDWKSMGVNGD